MTVMNWLQKAESFAIETYSPPKDIRSLSSTHVPYTGALQKHPFDEDRIILIPDPYSNTGPYLQFNRDDVTHAERLVNIVNMAGVAVPMARIWVKKGSLAIQCMPFKVSSL